MNSENNNDQNPVPSFEKSEMTIGDMIANDQDQKRSPAEINGMDLPQSIVESAYHLDAAAELKYHPEPETADDLSLLIVPDLKFEKPDSGIIDIKADADQLLKENNKGSEMEITGKYLLQNKIEKINCLIEPLLQEVGLACLGGPSDTGKSALLRQLAISVVTGEDRFLGFNLRAKHQSAIFVSNEDDHWATSFLLGRQASMYKSDQLEGLRFIFETDNLLKKLDGSLTDNPADLVIIDCFAEVYDGDLKNTRKIRTFLKDYELLASKHRCLILFLHHTGKRTENLEPSKNNLLSGQGLEARMRLVFELRADSTNPGYRHLCVVKGNYLPASFKKESYVLLFDERSFTFGNTGERVPFELLKQTGSDKHKAKYLQAKALRQDGANYDQIAEKLGYGSKGTISKLFDKAERNGWDKIVSGNVSDGNDGNNGNTMKSGVWKQETNEGDKTAEGSDMMDVAEVGNSTYKTTVHIMGCTETKTVADGIKIKGTYKIVSADDIIASHNEKTFAQSQGYPKNKNGTTVNDRDYFHDTNAQSEVIRTAQNFDARAITYIPIITKGGITIDGNQRIMSRKLAAAAGTDGEYLRALKECASRHGFKPEDIDNVKKPTLIFEPEQDLPYTTETLAIFNRAEKKEKSPIERAVEVSKTISPRALRVLDVIYSQAEKPSDVTSNRKCVKKLITLLLDENIIQSSELPRYFDVDNLTTTKEGGAFIESLLLGGALAEKAIRLLENDNMGTVRQKILKAIVPLTQNSALGENSLLDGIHGAIGLVNKAKQEQSSIIDAVRQLDMFSLGKFSTEELVLGIILDSAQFGKFLKDYNESVGKDVLFGGKWTKEKIIDNALKQLVNNYEQIRPHLRAAA